MGENGTPHWQGFVTFTNAIRTRGLSKILPRAALFAAKGSSLQNKHYCTKPVLDCQCSHCKDCPPPLEGPYEYGICPTAQGARTDIVQLRDAVKSGKRKRQIIEDDELLPTFAKHMKFATLVSTLYPPPPTRREIILLYGPAGCGKTRSVYDNHPLHDLYAKPVDDKLWFDGYDSQSVILLDDFAGRASKLGLTNLLRLLDRYPIQLPIKGGYVWLRHDALIISTNIHPSLWYDFSGREAQIPALLRRITSIRCWRADGSTSRWLHTPTEITDFYLSYSSRTSLYDESLKFNYMF